MRVHLAHTHTQLHGGVQCAVYDGASIGMNCRLTGLASVGFLGVLAARLLMIAPALYVFLFRAG